MMARLLASGTAEARHVVVVAIRRWAPPATRTLAEVALEIIISRTSALL